ncbi:hypothetical protein D3C87_1015140 [compost metagenome]
MLKGFTWEQFCWCWALLSLLWYGMVLLVWYPGGIKSFFGSNAVAFSGGSSISDRRLDGPEAGQLAEVASNDEQGSGVDGLMGRPALPQGMSVVGMGELGFVKVEDDGADRYDQVGLVADVVQELKLIFAQLATSAGEKADFFRLLDGVK